MSIIDEIKDKWQRNSRIYIHAYKAGKVMGYDYTWLLWKNHTKFLLRMRSPEDKKKEIQRMNRFMEEFCNVIDEYKKLPIYSENDIKNRESESTIWIYWNDESQMPEIIKAFIGNFYKMSNGCKVTIITEQSIADYIRFDDVIWQKYHEGKISLTHFSDLIRVALLYQYGGVYMDSTLLLTQPLPDIVTKSDFYTYHSDKVDITNVGYARWSSFFIAAHKGNLMMKAALDVFTEYWHRYDYLVDYVLIDYTFNLLYDKIPSVKRMIDSVPVNNRDIWLSQSSLLSTCSEKEYAAFLADDRRFLYKMSYKDTVGFPHRDESGNLTLMGRICGEK